MKEIESDVKSDGSVVSAKNDTTKKKSREERATKVVVRKLPPTMTEEEFLEQVSPLPENNYLNFVPANEWDECSDYARAYINFINTDDVVIFSQQFDGYVFLDSKGEEYPAVVELSPFQRIPKQRANRKKDALCGTIQDDQKYIAFVEEYMSADDEAAQPVNENFFDLQENKAKEEAEVTPLMEYILNRNREWQKFREEKKEERRKRELERKKAKEDLKRNKEIKETSVKEPVVADVKKEKAVEVKKIDDSSKIKRVKGGKSYQEERLKDLARKKKDDSKQSKAETKVAISTSAATVVTVTPVVATVAGMTASTVTATAASTVTATIAPTVAATTTPTVGTVVTTTATMSPVVSAKITERDTLTQQMSKSLQPRESEKLGIEERAEENEKIEMAGKNQKEKTKQQNEENGLVVTNGEVAFEERLESRPEEKDQHRHFSRSTDYNKSRYTTQKAPYYEGKNFRYRSQSHYPSRDYYYENRYRKPQKGYYSKYDYYEDDRYDSRKQPNRWSEKSYKYYDKKPVPAGNNYPTEKVKNEDVREKQQEKDTLKTQQNGKVVDDFVKKLKDTTRKETSTIRSDRRIKNKDRPALEIYRPGMGKYSKQKFEKRLSEESGKSE